MTPVSEWGIGDWSSLLTLAVIVWRGAQLEQRVALMWAWYQQHHRPREERDA